MKILSLLPWLDWLALCFFLAIWIGYAVFARRLALHRQSILAASNRYRLRWVKESLTRDPRVLDGIITQTLSHTPSFFFVDHHHHFGLFDCIDVLSRQSC